MLKVWLANFADARFDRWSMLFAVPPYTALAPYVPLDRPFELTQWVQTPVTLTFTFRYTGTELIGSGRAVDFPRPGEYVVDYATGEATRIGCYPRGGVGRALAIGGIAAALLVGIIAVAKRR